MSEVSERGRALVDVDGVEAIPPIVLAALIETGYEATELYEVTWSKADSARIDVKAKLRRPTADPILCSIEVAGA